MKPGEFGRKISELRKNKGLTQAELAERCNLNIRSIQRIESGKVLARPYTVKILSKALDHELTVPEMNHHWLAKMTNKFDGLFNSFLILRKNKKYGAKDVEKNLKTAWIAGIILFALSIPDTILYFVKAADYLPPALKIVYIIISVIMILLTIFFMRGFIIIGVNLNNNLLIIGSYLFIASTAIGYGYDLLTINQDMDAQKYVLGMFSVVDGFIGVFFGFGLMRIEDIFGNTAKYAGILNIIAGFTFVVIFLFFIGLILLIPITILEILILFKAAGNSDWITEKAVLA
jgi:transcriptional regulator with XRE-family HTH domain